MLTFLSTNEIKGTYKVNYLNQRVIFWVDGINDDRTLNIDNLPGSVSIAQMAISPKFKASAITGVQTLDSGGRMMTGCYEFALRYRFLNYSVTTIFGLSLPVYINLENSLTVAQADYARFDGSKSGVLTSKAVSLTITDIDTAYTAIDLIVIQTLNGTSIVTSMDNLQLNVSSTFTYTYTGTNLGTPINQGLTAVTVDPANFYGSEVIAQKENRLIRANFKQDKTVIRYQKYANNIVVSYDITPKVVQATTPVPNSQTLTTQDTLFQYCSYDPKVAEYNLTVLRGEVYSLGVSLVLNSGIETQVYHIPGRPHPIFQFSGPNPDTDLVTDHVRGGTNPGWMVNDTNYVDSNNRNLLSYWESGEQYPSGYDFPVDFYSSQTQVRHHKIPRANVLPITSTITNSNGTNSLATNYISLKFTNIQLPDAIKSQVRMLKFYMTPRDLDANKSIIAKGVFIRTALCGADVQYIGNAINGPLINPRYVIPASPFSQLPQDLAFNDVNFASSQAGANFANVKPNMAYFRDPSTGDSNTPYMADRSDASFPSPNTHYSSSSGAMPSE